MPEKTAFFYFYLTFCSYPGEISGLIVRDIWRASHTFGDQGLAVHQCAAEAGILGEWSATLKLIPACEGASTDGLPVIRPERHGDATYG
jgi:hypothetical protein